MMLDQLIGLYLWVCTCYQSVLCHYCRRYSNNQEQVITDEEIITIFFHGLRQGFRTLKQIYDYTINHLQEWFPNIKSYQNFNYRLNKLNVVFPILLEHLVEHCAPEIGATQECLIDSMPIILAQRSRRFHAKVATDIASNNGYCATKKLYYHGAKLHILAARQPGTLPKPELILLTNAGTNDNHALESMHISDIQLYADKAYHNSDINMEHRVQVIHPVKKKARQDYLDAAEQLYSTAVSKIRQPIESLFNWINEKTGIQMASKVRSTNGLLAHVFGRLCLAFIDRWAVV